MDSLIHPQTALKFLNEHVISSHTLLDMWLFIHGRINVNPYAPGQKHINNKKTTAPLLWSTKYVCITVVKQIRIRQ